MQHSRALALGWALLLNSAQREILARVLLPPAPSAASPAPSLPASDPGVGLVLPRGTPNPSRVSTAPGSARPVAPSAFQNPEIGFSIVCPPAWRLVSLLSSLFFSSTWKLVVCISSSRPGKNMWLLLFLCAKSWTFKGREKKP